MAYTAWSVVFGEQPSASKWNQLGTNDASFNDGTGIGSDVITDAKLIYGKVRTRQGGSSTNWQTQGTTTYDYSGTDTFWQAGTILSNASPKAVTFPTAFNQSPIVVATAVTAASNNVFVRLTSITTTGFNIQCIEGASGSSITTETVNWIAVGQ